MGRSSSSYCIGGYDSCYHKDVLLWHSHPFALLWRSLPVIRNSTADTLLTLYTTFWWEMGYKDIIIIMDLLWSVNLSLPICTRCSTRLLLLACGTFPLLHYCGTRSLLIKIWCLHQMTYKHYIQQQLVDVTMYKSHRVTTCPCWSELATCCPSCSALVLNSCCSPVTLDPFIPAVAHATCRYRFEHYARCIITDKWWIQ